VVLSIAGFDPTGGAGILADSRTVNRFGLHCIALITCQTSQNSKGFYSIKTTPISLLNDQFCRILEDYTISAIKIGLVTNLETLNFIVSILSTSLKSIPVVVDPIISATKSVRLINERFLTTFKKELIPLASVLTPNIAELKTLVGKEFTDKKEIERAAMLAVLLGPKYVAVTGINLQSLANKSNVKDLLTDGNELTYFNHARVNSHNSHGSGCIYSSSIASNLALGKSIYQSTDIAGRYLHHLLKGSDDYEFLSKSGRMNSYGPLLNNKNISTNSN
jgi:hydroxymethylpyrimidine/phosphomethylpyrimidine kinase